MENSAIKLKYKNVTTFNRYEFTSFMTKLKKTSTNNIAANNIHQVLKEIKRILKIVIDSYYTEVGDVYAKRNENGEIDREGADPAHTKFFKPDEAKIEEFEKAEKIWGEQEIEFKWKLLTPSDLKDISVSAEEIEMLGDIYSQENGPGIPNLQNISQMKRK